MAEVGAPTGSPDDRRPATARPAVAGLRRWRRRLWVAVALIGASVAFGVLATWAGIGAPPSVNHQVEDTGPRSGPAPAFRLADLADPARTIALADLRGRPAVVNFWASWCVPCRREMPRLAAAARRLDGRVAFLGVNYKDQRADALAFARDMGTPYPSVIDADGAVGDRYGIYGLPTTVFVDAGGRIVGRYLGEMKGGTLDRLLAELDKPQR